MKMSRLLLSLTLVTLLSACGMMTTTPKAPPPPTGQAQEITRAQTGSLEK